MTQREQVADKCVATTIDVQAKVLINGVSHSASIPHRCSLIEGHGGLCKCACGREFMKNFKGDRP